MPYNYNGGYNDSVYHEDYEIRSEAISSTMKTGFNYELSYTHARNSSGTKVIIVDWKEWKEFCIYLQEQKKAEAEKEEQKSNLIPNIDLVSRLDNLDIRLDTISNEQNKQLKDKDLQNSHLSKELEKEKLKNQNIKEKFEETSKQKQLKRLLHKIQNQNKWKMKKQPQVSKIRASKQAASKVKHRICYCCRQKGHLAKDCPFSTNPSTSEHIVVDSVFCVGNDIPVSGSGNSASVIATSASDSTSGTVAQVPVSQSFFEFVEKYFSSVLLFLFLWNLIENVDLFERSFPP